MRLLLLITTCLGLSASALGADSADPCYVISGAKRCFAGQNGIFVSYDCHSQAGHYDCAAAKSLSAVAGQRLTDEELDGGKNPGSLLCIKLKGKIVVAFDRFGNQVSLCQFADKSLTTSMSLANAFENAAARRRQGAAPAQPKH